MQPDKKNERDKDRKDLEQHPPKTARPPRELDDRQQQQKPNPRENPPRRSRP